MRGDTLLLPIVDSIPLYCTRIRVCCQGMTEMLRPLLGSSYEISRIAPSSPAPSAPVVRARRQISSAAIFERF